MKNLFTIEAKELISFLEKSPQNGSIYCSKELLSIKGIGEIEISYLTVGRDNAYNSKIQIGTSILDSEKTEVYL